MIPETVVGLAILTLIWMVLWWFTGDRRPLSHLSCGTVAIACMVLAIHEALIDQVLVAISFSINAFCWARASGRREPVLLMVEPVGDEGPSSPL